MDITAGHRPDTQDLSDFLRTRTPIPDEIREYVADLIDPRVRSKGGRPRKKKPNWNTRLRMAAHEASELRRGKSMQIQRCLNTAADQWAVPRSELRKYFYSLYLSADGAALERFLREKGLSADEALAATAKHLGVSRTTLSKRFKQDRAI